MDKMCKKCSTSTRYSNGYCKKCVINRSRIYRRNNKERIALKQIKYRREHKKEIVEYRQKHREKNIKYLKKYYKKRKLFIETNRHYVTDFYLKRLICERSVLNFNDIPQVFLELKRQQVLASRLVKQQTINNKKMK